jgi:hypothetical protein
MVLGKGIRPDEFRFIEVALGANQKVVGRGMNCRFNLGNSLTNSNLRQNLKIL